MDGGAGDDRVIGGSDDDLVLGGPGQDLVEGRDGDDELRGDAGSDILAGGSGSDRFMLGDDGIDRITDFSDDDVLVLTDLLGDAGLPSEPDGDDLDQFLQFSLDEGDTQLAIDRDGAAEFANADVRTIVENVDLVGTAPSQAAVIDGLLHGGQLEVA